MAIKSLVKTGAFVRDAAFFANAELRSAARSATQARRLWRRSSSIGAAATSFLVAIASVLANPSATAAAESNLTLVCPSDGMGEPHFADATTGKLVAISDPRLMAVAAESCEAGAAQNQATAVSIVNGRSVPIYVSFTVRITNKIHMPGPISWGSGCMPLAGGGVMIAAKAACAAKVRSTGQELAFAL